MNREKYLRASLRFLAASLGAVIAVNSEPATTWEWVQTLSGVLVAGFTAFEAFLSKFAGLNQ